MSCQTRLADFYQGATFSLPLISESAETGKRLDIAGYLFVTTLKSAVALPDSDAAWQVSRQVPSDAPVYEDVLTVPPIVTASLAPGDYFIDVIRVAPDGTLDVILEQPICCLDHATDGLPGVDPDAPLAPTYKSLADLIDDEFGPYVNDIEGKVAQAESAAQQADGSAQEALAAAVAAISAEAAGDASAEQAGAAASTATEAAAVTVDARDTAVLASTQSQEAAVDSIAAAGTSTTQSGLAQAAAVQTQAALTATVAQAEIAAMSSVTAQAASRSYDTEPIGRAATTDGQYFLKRVSNIEYELWRRDSSAASTRFLPNIILGLNLNVSNLGGYGPTLIPVMYGVPDVNGQLPFAILNNGKSLIDLDPSSRAYKWVQALVAANAPSSVTDNAVSFGGAIGSPIPLSRTLEAHVDSLGRLAYGVGADGAFLIGKYDANLAAAVLATGFPSAYVVQGPGSQLLSYSAGSSAIVTSEGNNTSPAPVGAQKTAFLSDRYRGQLAPYVMNNDGSNQRRMLSAPSLEGVGYTGQSNVVGFGTSAATIAPPYPVNALQLSGSGPVRSGTNNIGGSETLVSLRETTVETSATGFAAALLATELAQRNRLVQVVFGHGLNGTPYAGLAKGTATYNDVIAQVTRIKALKPSFIVRAMNVVHGENDYNNASYDANVTQWQSDYETDIKAVTGQAESVMFLISQRASIRYYSPTSFNTDQSALKQLAVSLANPKVALVVSQYIFAFQADNLHLSALSQRRMGEYFAKAYRRVVIEGRDIKFAPKTVTVIGSSVVIDFDAMFSLQFSTLYCTDPGNLGFTYSDSASQTITGVTLTGPKQVTVTLSGAPAASAILDYAYNNGTADKSGPTEGARGLLCDTDPTLSIYDSAPLFNPCPIFKLNIN